MFPHHTHHTGLFEKTHVIKSRPRVTISVMETAISQQLPFTLAFIIQSLKPTYLRALAYPAGLGEPNRWSGCFLNRILPHTEWGCATSALKLRNCNWRNLTKRVLQRVRDEFHCQPCSGWKHAEGSTAICSGQSAQGDLSHSITIMPRVSRPNAMGITHSGIYLRGEQVEEYVDHSRDFTEQG